MFRQPIRSICDSAALHYALVSEEGWGPVRFVRVASVGGSGGISGASLRLFGVLWWMLAVLVMVLAAALVWALLTPLGPLGDWRPREPRVIASAARAALIAGVDPFNRGTATVSPNQTQSVTSLALVLYGTRGMPGGGGSAIIAGADGIQQVFRTGEAVTPGVTLAGVAFDHVMLSHGGASEMLYMDQSRKAPEMATNAGVANDPAASLRIGAATGPLGPAAGLPAPLTVDAARSGISFGQSSGAGLAVQAAGDGSAFRAAGFRPGDVITGIGGKPVAGPADAAGLASALKPGASVPITVRRDGRDLPLAITVAP